MSEEIYYTQKQKQQPTIADLNSMLYQIIICLNNDREEIRH